MRDSMPKRPSGHRQVDKIRDVRKKRAARPTIESVDDIEMLVRLFYRAVVPDAVLGPTFHAMQVDWSAHIPKIVDYWADRLLGHRDYDGDPVAAHQPVLDRFPFGAAEVNRWLELWDETVDEYFVGRVAERAKERAHHEGIAIAALARRHSAAQLTGE